MENVHITPHNGIMMTWQDYIRGAIEVFLANLERYINGAALKNVIDPSPGGTDHARSQARAMRR